MQRLLTDGQAAFTAKKFSDAVAMFQQAKALDPPNVDVVAALSKAEQARDRALAEAKRTGRNRCIVLGVDTRPFEQAG